MQLNLIDRAIAAVDPVRAAQRLRARVAISALAGDGPSGAESASEPGGGVLRRWRPALRDAVSDTLRHLPLQRGQSRELVRTNPIAAGAIQTNVDRVVGTGLVPVPEPDRAVLGWSEQQLLDWQHLLRREFSLWADSPECDYAGEQTFYEKQGLVLSSTLISGDVFTVLPDAAPTATQPYRLRLQTIEADRVGNPLGKPNTPEVTAGVMRDASGLATAYHVYDRHPGGALFVGATLGQGQWIERIGRSGRRRILHHYRLLRPEQPRGVPYLSPVVDSIKQLGRYTEAEIQAAVVSAFFTVFVQTKDGGSPAPVFGLQPGAQAPNQEIAMGPGAVVGLADGETVSTADPGRPNPAFDPFVQAIVQQIGVGLGIPFEVLMKRFNASYSASRAALLDAWMWFRGLRAWLARSFCQPVRETWMAEAVAIGRIPAPGFFTDPLLRWAYTRAAWHGDSQGSINPKDEVAAYLAAVDGRLMTRERAQWELLGTDWYADFDAKVTEQNMLRAADMLPVPKAGAAAPQPSEREGA